MRAVLQSGIHAKHLRTGEQIGPIRGSSSAKCSLCPPMADPEEGDNHRQPGNGQNAVSALKYHVKPLCRPPFLSRLKTPAQKNLLLPWQSKCPRDGKFMTWR